MAQRVKRYFCYGVGLASLLWGSILIMYLQLQEPPSPGHQLSHRPQRLRARREFNWGDSKPRNLDTGDDDQTKHDLSQLGLIKTPEDQQKRDKGYKLYAFNELISERLGFHRQIPDVRHFLCQSQTYPEGLPTASIIICFYNEAWSTLLRTVHSVLDRSPQHLIQEIILVDDHSDLAHLGKPLEDYMGNISKVQIWRATERLGLIRARMLGAHHATGQVLIFLDSHCEVNVLWLQPLLARIHDNTHILAIPIIDIINQDTFEYESSPLVRGGFNWGLHYRWDNIPHSLFTNKEDFVKPIRTATMAGGLFAVGRQFFNQMGRYDPGMDVWGGENLEISFRMWQCGGQLEIIPCSRVAHVFRKRRPYGDPLGTNTMLRNSLRVAHVWMDDYKEYYFKIRPEARNASYGDIAERLALRKELKCKSFKWYLDNVYPEQTLPNQKGQGGTLPKNENFQKSAPKVSREGHLRHKASGLCVIATESVYDKHSLLQLGPCLQEQKEQAWSEIEEHYLQLGAVLCLDIEVDLQQRQPYPRLMKCHLSHGSQEWRWIGPLQKQLLNPASGKCLSVQEQSSGAYLTMAVCDDNDSLQKFEMVICIGTGSDMASILMRGMLGTGSDVMDHLDTVPCNAVCPSD